MQSAISVRIELFLWGMLAISKYADGGKFMDTIALILSIIGSLNWGLVGIFKFDLVAWLFGGQSAVLSRIIYTLVGLAGLWCITILFRKCKARMEEE